MATPDRIIADLRSRHRHFTMQAANGVDEYALRESQARAVFGTVGNAIGAAAEVATVVGESLLQFNWTDPQ